MIASLGASAQAATAPCSLAKVRATLYQCRSAFERTRSAHDSAANTESDAPYERRLAAQHDAFTTCDRAASPSADCSASKNRAERHEADVAGLETLWNEMMITYWAHQYESTKGLGKTRKLVALLLDRDGEHEMALNAYRETESFVADTEAEICAERAIKIDHRLDALRAKRGFMDYAAGMRPRIQHLKTCAGKASSSLKRADVYYRAMVAAEETGRAFLAANMREQASESLGKCLQLYDVISSKLGADNVPRYMTDILTMCKGRLDGRYDVDFPRPFDESDDGIFRPLVIPTPSPDPTAN